MKRQVKVNESELHSIIEGAVRNLLKEYDPHMAGLGAARGLEQGNLGPWNAAQKIMKRDKWDKSQLNDFQNGFERKPTIQNGQELEEYTDAEMAQGMRMFGRPSYDEHEFDDFNEQPANNLATNESKQYKVNEAQLHQIIKESVMRIFKKKINEAFKSPKLDAMARQHGGIRKNGYGFYGENEFPISDLTDDMIGNEASKLDAQTGIANNAVNFKDGTSVPIINKEKAMSMQRNFDDAQSKRGRYSTPSSYYTKFNVAPTSDQRHLQALRKDLNTSNRLKQDPNNVNAQRTYNQHWKGWEGPTRSQINQAYAQNRGQRDIQGIGNQ